MYQDMETVIGFRPTYPNYGSEDHRYFFAHLDNQQPLVISDYDISVTINSERYTGYQGKSSSTRFLLRGEEYQLYVDRSSSEDERILIKNSAGTELIGTGIIDFIMELEEGGGELKEMLPPAKMTLESVQNNYRLKIIFRDININYGSDPKPIIHYSADILFGAGE